MLEQVESTTTEIPPVTAAASPGGAIRMISIDQIYESKKNPRQYYPEPVMAELTESMKACGFREWQPLMVRPIPKEPGLSQFEQMYEIGAGHRRSRAARTAGIEMIPCIVREMSDEEFLDVLNFDNTAREDPHPLDESAGWHNWMKETGKGVLDIVAKIGQSKEYVYQRLKFASLIDEAKKAFLNGEFGSGHAILIARLQKSDQAKALKFAITEDWQHHRPSVRQLADFIQRDVHLDMARATFDLDSAALLPAAGTCTACPKRTKNAPELLLDIEKVNDPDADDCTDPSCFNAKLSAHLVQIKAKLAAEGVKPVEVSSNHGPANSKGPLKAGNYQQVTPDVKNAQTAIIADGARAGTVIHITVNAPKPSSSKATNSEAGKKAEEKRLAQANLELLVRRAILDAIRVKVTDVSRVDVEFLVRECLANSGGDEDEMVRLHGEAIGNASFTALDKALSNLRDQEIFQLAVELPLFGDLYRYRLNQPAEALLAAAKRYKVDTAKIRIQVEAAAKKPAAPPAPAKPAPKVPPPTKKAAPAKKTIAKKAVAPAKKKGIAKKAK